MINYIFTTDYLQSTFTINKVNIFYFTSCLKGSFVVDPTVGSLVALIRVMDRGRWWEDCSVQDIMKAPF